MLKLPGISVAHGTKSSLNKEKEYRITFSMNSNDGQQFSAWQNIQKYRFKRLF
jgi:hypothetical protein